MAKKNNINNSALSKLCSYICLAANNINLINDTLQAQDKVFSSKHVTDLINSMSEQDRKYVDDIVANLNKLSSKTTTVIPDSSNAEPNTLYLYSADPNPTSYNQYMVLSDKTILDLGTTNISLDGYLKEVDADNKYLKQVDSHSHDNKLILDTISQAKIDEWDKGGDGLIPVTKAQHNELVTNGSTTINGKVVTYDSEAFYVITDDENSTVDMSQYLTAADKVNMGIYAGDLNNVVVDKIDNVYVFGVSPSECTNLPINDYGMLEVMYITSNNFCIQRFTSITNEIYTRNKVSGNWNAWRKLCSTSVADTDVVSKSISNDEVSSGNIQYKVINGICHLSLLNLRFSKTAIVLKMLPDDTVPRCAINECWGVITDVSGSTNNALIRVSQEGCLGHYILNDITKAYSGYFSYPVKEN